MVAGCKFIDKAIAIIHRSNPSFSLSSSRTAALSFLIITALARSIYFPVFRTYFFLASFSHCTSFITVAVSRAERIAGAAATDQTKAKLSLSQLPKSFRKRPRVNVLIFNCIRRRFSSPTGCCICSISDHFHSFGALNEHFCRAGISRRRMVEIVSLCPARRSRRAA